MDFITGLPFYRGKESVLVVVDILSKMTYFMALKQCIATGCSGILGSHLLIYKLHGVLKGIVSDRDLSS